VCVFVCVCAWCLYGVFGRVQFVYGDDGMDPVTMEGKGASALDFDTVLGKVCMFFCLCVYVCERIVFVRCFWARGTAWTL